MSLRFSHYLRPVSRPLAGSTKVSTRSYRPSSILRTQAGYGDPQDEKIANETPKPQASKDAHGHSTAGHGGSGKPSSAADPQPDGQGKGVGQSGGTTDPEVKPGKVGSAGSGGKGSDGGSGAEHVTESEIKETKKVGEDPKKEEVGGAGVIGG